MRRFLRRSAAAEPLPITMTGVRMGERVLQIGVNDPGLAGQLAAKAGLSGHAAVVVHTEAAADRARAGAAEAGVLIDLHVAPPQSLPLPEASFDVAIVNSLDGLLATSDSATRGRLLGEIHRVVRTGGRVVVIEAGPKSGLAGLLHSEKSTPEYKAAGGAVSALEAAGFKPVRLIAEREGYRFTEGLKARG